MTTAAIPANTSNVDPILRSPEARCRSTAASRVRKASGRESDSYTNVAPKKRNPGFAMYRRAAIPAAREDLLACSYRRYKERTPTSLDTPSTTTPDWNMLSPLNEVIDAVTTDRPGYRE